MAVNVRRYFTRYVKLTNVKLITIAQRTQMNFSEHTDAEILAIANPFLDNVIDASNEINYEKFSKDLSKNMKMSFLKLTLFSNKQRLKSSLAR